MPTPSLRVFARCHKLCCHAPCSRREHRRPGMIRFLLPFLAIPLWAQDQTPAQAPAPQEQSPAQGTGKKQDNGTSDRAKQANGTSKDRLFFTLPNFLTLENGANVPPLTAGEKFKVTARGSFDPMELLWYGARAGISQAEDDEASYRQGTEGYAKRFGVRFADGTLDNFTTRAIFPSLLHQDPRYFQMGKGGFWRRAGYALTRIVITRSDSGSRQLNYSEILGSGVAAEISSYTYHPREDRNQLDMMSIWGTQVAFDALSYELKEFWPDLRRKLHKTQPGPSDQAVQPAAGH